MRNLLFFLGFTFLILSMGCESHKNEEQRNKPPTKETTKGSSHQEHLEKPKPKDSINKKQIAAILAVVEVATKGQGKVSSIKKISP